MAAAEELNLLFPFTYPFPRLLGCCWKSRADREMKLMSRSERMSLKLSEGSEDEDDEVVAYLVLPDHPGEGRANVKKNIRLRDLVGEYTGPDLFFDFNEENVLVGVEILD